MKNIKIKKIIFILICIFQTFFAFSRNSKKEPDWIQNYRTIFPDNKYLAQLGTAKTAEEAKTNAVAQIANYLQAKVNANLTTASSIGEKNSKKTEEVSIYENVEILSQVELFSLEFTEPFYKKKKKLWYCVAYINRLDAWNVYKTQIEMAKNIFYNFYNKATTEPEPFLKYSYYKQAWQESKSFLEKLEYGYLIHPKEAGNYNNDKANIALIPSLINESIKNSTMNFIIKGDYGNILETAIKQTFSEEGFIISKNGHYNLSVFVNNNIEGSNPISIYPSITIELLNSNGKIFYTYNYKHQEKTVAYNLETAQKRIFPKIAEILNKGIPEDLHKTFTF